MTPEKDDSADGNGRRHILWPMPRVELCSLRQRAADRPDIVASEMRRLEFDLAVARNAIEALSDAASAACEQRDRAERLLIIATKHSAWLNGVIGELRADIETLKGKGPIA